MYIIMISMKTITKLFISSFLVLILYSNVHAYEDELYYPFYDKNSTRPGVFWMMFDLSSFIPINTKADVLPQIPAIAPGVIIGFTIIDFFGFEGQFSYQSYNGFGSLFSDTGETPRQAGKETLTKLDIGGYLMAQPSFSISNKIKFIPYVGIGALYYQAEYSYVREIPEFLFNTNTSGVAFSVKTGVRFKFINILVGAGIQYNLIANDSGYDFSSLSYALTLGFMI